MFSEEAAVVYIKGPLERQDIQTDYEEIHLFFSRQGVEKTEANGNFYCLSTSMDTCFTLVLIDLSSAFSCQA